MTKATVPGASFPILILHFAAQLFPPRTHPMATPYIPYRLDGKVALVTGSGRGIGAAMAVHLGRCGARVVVNYARSRESAQRVVAEIQSLGSDAVAFQADVRQVPQTAKLMADAVRHFGGLDIVCSNSGVVSFGHMGDVTEVGVPLDRDDAREAGAAAWEN